MVSFRVIVFLLLMGWLCTPVLADGGGRDGLTEQPTENLNLASDEPDRGTGDTLRKLTEQAEIFLDDLVKDIQKPLLPWFQYLGYSLALVMFYVSFLKRGRAGEGPVDLMFFFLRTAVMLVLCYSIVHVLQYAFYVGNVMAYGTSGRQTYLDTIRQKEEEKFIEDYEKFVRNQFFVKVEGEPVTILDEKYQWYAVLFSEEQTARTTSDTVKETIRNFDPQGWNMGRVLSAFHLARLVFDFGDLYLIMLGPLFAIAISLTAPLACAGAVDKEINDQVVKKYWWGCAVYTLFFPTTVQILRICGLKAGNMVWAVGSTTEAFHWDPQTLSVVTLDGSAPVLRAAIGAAVCLFFGFAKFASPFIAYYVSMGQVYNAAANIGNQAFGFASSTAASFFSGVLAANIQRAAELNTAQAGADSGAARAEGKRRFDDTQARLRAQTAHAGVSARQVQGLAANRANAQYAKDLSVANFRFNTATLNAGTDESIGMAQNNNEFWQRQNDNQAELSQMSNQMNVVQEVAGNSGAGRTGTAIVGLIPQSYAADYRRGLGNTTTQAYTDANVKTIAKGAYGTVGMHRDPTNPANEPYLGGRAGAFRDLRDATNTAADAQKATLDGGVNAAAGIEHGAINNQLGGELRANADMMNVELGALETMRQAGFNAANASYSATIVRALGEGVAAGIREATEGNKI